MDTPDVIIIGSGIGGLIDGNLLAKKGHNTDGASSAWSWNPKKKFYKNTMSVNIETPVKSLYIGSCWAMQIGGVPGALAAAYQCAKKIK